MDLRQQAKNVANQGRYGDSMLLHVNPVEMKGLASAMPLTVNPQTGQPEAFLPFLAPILGSVLGKAFLGNALGNIAASAIGSGLAQTAATGDVRKGLLAGLTGFGLGQFLNKLPIAGADVAAQEAAKSALQQSGVPLTGEVGKNIIAEAGAQNVAEAAKTAATSSGNILQNLGEQGTQIANVFEPAISPNVKDNIFSSISQATGAPVQEAANLLPSGLEVGTKATLQTLSDPSVYIPTGIGMGTTASMISQEEFERYMANAPEREKERLRQLMAMYPEAIPMQEGGFLNDPLIYEAGRALALDEINKRTRRQMSPERKAAYERAYALYGRNTLSGQESRPGGGGGGGGNQGNGQFDGGEDNPLIRRANPIPQGFIGGFAPEFSYFGNVNPSATDLRTGASQAGLSGQGRFAPQAGSGVQLANRDLSANLYADAFANAIPDLTSEQRQQARDYAFQVETTNDFDPTTETLPMPEFLQSKDFLKGFEAGNKVRSQVQANPNQFGIATPGQFSPTQTAGYRQFYGSSAIGVPQVIDPFSPFQGFSVSPFTPSALPPPIAPIPPSAGTDPDKDPDRNGGQRGEEDTGTGQGDQTKDETRDAGTETRFLPDLTRDQFDLMAQGQEDFADLRRRYENILGIPEAPIEDTPVADAPVADVPDYAQQLADQAQLIQQLQEQIASNQAAISGIPSVDTSGFLTQEDLSSAIAAIPSFDPSALQSDISGLQTGLAGLQGQFQGFTPFDPTAIQNQLAALQEAQLGFASDIGGLQGQFQGFTPFDPSNIASQISDLQTGLAGLQGQFQGFTPSPTTISFDDIQGAPDFSQFATQDDLSTAISGIPQFDPSTLDLSGFATQDDLSTAISGIPQFDPSTLNLPDFSQFATTDQLFDPSTFDFSSIDFGFDPSDFATTQDLSTAISGIPQFDPSTLGLPDFSQFATTQDLSTAISGIPQFDPSSLGLPDFSQFATTEDLSSAISGIPQFDPSTLNLPDFSQFATTDQLFDPSTFDFSGVDFGFDPSQFATTEDLSTAISGVPQFDPTTIDFSDIQGTPSFLTSSDLTNLFTVGDPRAIAYDSPYGALEKSLMSRFNQARQMSDNPVIGDQQNRLRDLYNTFTPSPTTINFGDIQGVPDFSQFATTDQLFDPSTLNLPDFSQFATTDQLFDPSSIQAQIDALQGLLDQQSGTPQAETYGPTGTPGPQTTTSPKSAPVVGRSDGGDTNFPDLTGDGKVTQADILKGRGVDLKSEGKGLKLVPEDNKGLAKLPEEVRNKMGFMAPGGDTSSPEITQAMLDDPLTNQVAQFILGNETNDEVVSAFIDKYGSNAFRAIRRAVLKTLAPNAQTEGMIKGSLAGGMEDDIFGVIGDPNKNGQRVAVSQDEFIVPADVVSMLGDGSSDAGANKLEMMMDRIRTEKTNTTKQARPINDKRVLPA